MPYSNDFGCSIPAGLKCISPYEVNNMADLGMFEPNDGDNYNKVNNRDRFNKCCGKRIKMK